MSERAQPGISPEIHRTDRGSRTACAAMTRTGHRCRNTAAPGESYCRPHLRRSAAAYTPEIAAQLLVMLRAGNSIRASARASGLSDATVRNWISRGDAGEAPYAEFANDLRAARATAEVTNVARVAQAARDDWHAATWMLDRRLRDEKEAFDTTEVAALAADRARSEAEATLAAIGEPVELSAGAIERYAAAVAAVASLQAHWEHEGRPVMTLGGATGSAEVPHPLPAQIALARREAAALGAQLGLDPLSRMKLARHIGAGRPPGAASAADRAAGPPRRRLRAVD